MEPILCFSSSALGSIVWNSDLCARNVKHFFLCIRNNSRIVLKLAKFYKNPFDRADKLCQSISWSHENWKVCSVKTTSWCHPGRNSFESEVVGFVWLMCARVTVSFTPGAGAELAPGELAVDPSRDGCALCASSFVRRIAVLLHDSRMLELCSHLWKTVCVSIFVVNNSEV